MTDIIKTLLEHMIENRGHGYGAHWAARGKICLHHSTTDSKWRFYLEDGGLSEPFDSVVECLEAAVRYYLR